MIEELSESAGAVPIQLQVWDTFLSYARDDSSVARELRSELGRKKLSVWKAGPRSVHQVGRRRPRRDGPRASATFVLLFSQASLASPRVSRELKIARRTLPMERIVCVLLPGVDAVSLPSWLRNQPAMHLASADQVPVLAKELRKRILRSLKGNIDGVAPRITTVGYFPPAARLVGVDEYHAQLLARQSGLTWVAGAAGTGKTALTADFVRRFGHKFREVVWIGASSGSSASNLIESLRNQGERLTGALLVVDSDGSDVSNSLWFKHVSFAMSVSNRVIVTARSMTDVRPFAMEEQDLIMLPRQGKPADRVRRRWETLLADTQTAPIPVIHEPADTYSRVWSRASPSLLWRSHSKDPTVESGITRLASEVLSSLTAQERERLTFAAFVPDLWLWGRFADRWGDPADDAVVQRLLLMSAIERSPDGLVLHHLLADTIRRSAERRTREKLANLIRSRLPSPSANEALEILPGVSSFLESALATSDHPPESLVDLAIWVASAWRAAGSPRQAQHAADGARELSDSLNDPETRVRVMNLLSGIAADQGRLSESASLERRAIEIATATLGPTHPTTLAVIANYASTLGQQGRHAEAISILHFVLNQLDSSTETQNDERTAIQLHLGSAYRDAGLVDRALEMLSGLKTNDRALQSRVEQETVLALLSAGRAREALPLLYTAIANAERETDKIEWLGRLALAQDKVGDRRLAVRTQSSSVRKAETYLGDLHPSTLGARANLAILLGAAGRHQEALGIASTVAEHRRTVLGEDSQLYLATLLICAAAAERLDLADRAADQYRLAISGYERTMGARAISTLRARERLTRLLRRSGSPAQVNLMAKELLADVRAVLPADHPMTHRVEKLATNYLA